jgi:hypothetical protein
LEIALGHRYAFTTTPVLHYRVTGESSMVALEKLEHGYQAVIRWMRDRPELVDANQLRKATWKVRRMMCGAYLHAGKPTSAVGAVFR